MKDDNDVTNGCSDEAAEDDFDMEPVLEALGPRGLYHAIQLTLQIISSLFSPFLILGVLFIGYRPTYRCNEVNSTQLDAFLGQDVSENTTVSLEYQKCSLDVTLNTSGAVTTRSLSCVNGINFSMPSDTSFLTEWSLVCDKAGLTELTQTIYMVGQAIGSLFFANLGDLFGRKKVNVFCATGTLIMSAAACMAPNYYILLVCRVLTGTAYTGHAMSGYTMCMELSPRRWRGTATCITNVLWTCGCIIMATIAYLMRGISWRLLNLAFTAGFTYCLLLPCFLDESIRWLMATGNIIEVERILQKACRLNGKDFRHVKKVLHAAITESRNKKQKPSASPNKAMSEISSDLSSKNLLASGEKLGGAGISGHAPQETDLKLLSVENDNDVKKQKSSISPSKVISEDTGSPSNNLLADANLSGVDSASGHAENMAEVGLPSLRCEIVGRNIDADKGEIEVRPARYTILDVCKHRVLLLHVAVLSFVWATNSLFYYGAMLGSVSLIGNRFLNFGLMSVMEGVSSFLSFGIIPRLNRRTVGTLFGMVTSLSTLFSVAIMQLVSGSLGKTLASVGWFVGMFSVSMSYIVMFVVCVEVIPTCIRTTGRAFALSISRLSGMLAPFVLLMGEDIPWAPGLLIGFLCFLASLTFLLLPETRHRELPTTVEEIMAWKGKNSHVAKESAEKSSISASGTKRERTHIGRLD